MGWWEKIFAGGADRAPGLADERFASFLRGWEYELRSRPAPASELLEAAPERFFEHFPDAFDEPTSKRLLLELVSWTERFIAGEKTAEDSWTTATENDRLTAAFEALRERDLIAREDAGVSIQDGWGEVGLHQRRQHRGAVFFHQQDILGALRGEELLLAFGTFDERPGAPSGEEVGQEVMEALAAQGLAATWSGSARTRIRLAPFPWKKRRWTSAPPAPPGHGSGPAPVPLTDAQLHTPDALRPENAAVFNQRVTAVRSSAGFNVRLSEGFEALWRKHGGVRGQLCHVGLPHVFVPAGEQTDLGVCNAYLNLDPAEAAALRRRGRSAIIGRERQAAVRAVPWSRPQWTAGGGPGRVNLIVVSDSPLSELAGDASPVDLSEWSPYVDVPDAFSWVYRDRQAEPERFSSLETAARLAQEHTTTGPGPDVVEKLQRARYGALVQGEVPDPTDLGYLQFGWAIARWLLERGDGAVLDTLSSRWWTRDELAGWEAGGWPTGRRFMVQRELLFTSGAAGDSWLLGTQGLMKFGRPDLLCAVRPDRLDTTPKFATASIPGWAPEALEAFATRLALGARIQPGETLQLGSVTFTVEQCRPGVNAPMEVAEETLVLKADTA